MCAGRARTLTQPIGLLLGSEGAGLRPFSVAHDEQPWRTARSPGDLTIRWTRRSRSLAADTWGAGFDLWYDRVGFDDFERDTRRKLDRDRVAFMQRHEAGHAFLQPLSLITDDIPRDRDLIEGLGVHEIVPHVVFVKIIEVFFIEVGALDLIGRAVALGHLHAIGDAAHFEMGDGRAFAGVDVFRVHDDGKLSVEIEHIAFTDRACDNLDHLTSPFSNSK